MWLQKFSMLLWGNHLDNRDARQVSSGQRVLEYGECQPLIYISSANSTLDECLVALGDAALSNGTCQDNIIWHKDMGNICDARISCAWNIQRKSEPLWFVAFCLRRATVAKVVCSQGFCGNGFTFLNLRNFRMKCIVRCCVVCYCKTKCENVRYAFLYWADCSFCFLQLAKDMSAAAVRTIRKEIKELYINIQPQQEKEKACGNGNGIM